MSEAGPVASFRFTTCAAVLVELPTESARRLLPADLHPVELHHGSSVLSVMACDFSDTPFGPYRELALAVAVAPRVRAGEAMPQSAFFPFVVASTSSEAREFAVAQLHLPYYGGDADIVIERDGDGTLAALIDRNEPIVDMRVTEHDWHDVTQLYQSFMRDSHGLWTGDMVMAGRFSEHEDELGSLTLHPHAFTSAIDLKDIAERPFREQLMRDGTQTFQAIRRVVGATRS